jgi:hypothetical protein
MCIDLCNVSPGFHVKLVVTSVDAGDFAVNQAIQRVASVWGVIFGISSMSHGFFESMQGTTPTGGLMIEAVSEGQRFWSHGAEPALTILPNFLMTGIAAMLLGLALIVWSLRYLDTSRSASVLLGLFVLSMLVGGGIAQVLLFPFICVFAAHIHLPLACWAHILPERLRAVIAPWWGWLLGLSAAALLYTLFVATFGLVPGLSDEAQILNVMGLLLVVALGSYILSFLAALAHDIGG